MYSIEHETLANITDTVTLVSASILSQVSATHMMISKPANLQMTCRDLD